MSQHDRPAGQDDRSTTAARGPRPWYRRPLFWGIAGGVVLAGGYGTAALALGGTAPRGTTVLGTAVGGMDAGEVRSALAGPARAADEQPLAVEVSGNGAAFAGPVAPAEAGLGVDVAATASELTGPAWAPVEIWRHLTGGGERRPVVSSDRAQLTAALAPVSEAVDAPVVEGAVTFAVQDPTVPGGPATVRPEVQDPSAGRSFDVGAAASAIAAAWPGTDRFTFSTAVVEPTVDRAGLEAAVTSLATPAVAADLTVVAGDRQAVLPPAAFAPALAVRPVDGEARLVADGTALQAAVRAAAPEFETPARDAGIEIRDGAPVVVPAVAGVGVPPEDLAAAVVDALTPGGSSPGGTSSATPSSTASGTPSSTPSGSAAPTTAAATDGADPTAEPTRRAVVTPVQTQPSLTTEAVEDLRIVERMSTFSTTLTANQARTANIRRAAAAVNGTILRPDQEFSMNDTVGERTPERGYNRAGVISDGRLVDDYGGGVSQLSTTLFNAVFFAGLDELEHKPHSFYISRYPEGREATIDWRSIDNRFRNDSGHGVYVEAGITGNQVTVSLYGTRFMDVRAEKSARRAITSPRTIYDTSAGCSSQSPNSGFTVDVTRVMTPLAGGPEQRETWTTRYNPQNRIVCGPDPATVRPTPTPTPSASTPAPAPTPEG
ncbi:VanW family protein [Kineococcus gynurae]|uniref:VanW family protein n=1 Tax=Kineococcus gynurae TaxID=452979 RepID=A0ABV5LU77_9ACTN